MSPVETCARAPVPANCLASSKLPLAAGRCSSAVFNTLFYSNHCLQRCLLTLLLLLSLVLANPAFARQSNFNSAAFAFLDKNTVSFSCSGCHTDLSANDSAIVVTAPATLQEGLTKLKLTAAGQVTSSGSSYIWRYRIGSQPIGSSSEYKVSSKTIDVPSSGNVQLKYCIADAVVALDETTRRRWHCSSQTVTRTAPPNAAPTITNVQPASPLSVDVLEITNFIVSASDSEDQTALVYDLSSKGFDNVELVSIQQAANGKSATYTVKGVKAGSDTLQIRVSDGGKSVTTDYIVNVASVNQAPEITDLDPSGEITMTVGQSRTVSVTATDENVAGLEYAVEFEPADLAELVSQSGSDLTISALKVGTGKAKFIVFDDSSEPKTDSLTVDISVKAKPVVNQPPNIIGIIPGTTVNLKKGEFGSFSLNVEDDNDAPSSLTYSFNTTPPSGATVVHSGSGKFSVEAKAVGETVVDIEVTDSGGESTKATVTLIITEEDIPNKPPVITSPSAEAVINLVVDGVVTITLEVEDEMPDSVVFSVKPVVAGIVSVDSQPGGQLDVTGLQPGSTVLQIIATDNQGESAVILISVVVEANDNPPVAESDQFIFNFQSESQLLDVLANDSDPEGSALEVSLDSAQSTLGGGIVVSGSAVSYTAPPDFSGEDQFIYFAVDGSGQKSAAATVTVKPSDFDSDSVFDGTDNCVLLVNTAQSDSDQDEVGDICDADPDGDGVLGDTNNPFSTGKSLVESVCTECHREPISGAPQIGDKDAWIARINAAPNGIFTLIESVTNGKGDMPARGALNTARELSQAVLFLTGIEDPAVSVNFNDRDLDGVSDLSDNCLNFANADQADTDGNGIGDVCEPDSNGDGRLDYSASLVIFQETESANRNGGIVLQKGGAITLVARLRADLPGLSYSWSDSSAEIIQAIGGGASNNVEVIPAGSLAVGTYTVAVTVKGAGVTGQTRSLLTVVNTNADISDPDFDGYPASLDSDNFNAQRLQADPTVPGNKNLLLTPSALTTGRFATELARTAGYTSVKLVLSESELKLASQFLYPGVTPDSEPSLKSSIGIMDVELHELDTSVGTLIVELQANIPLFAGLKIYNPATGKWAKFVESGAESLSSAPIFNKECPPATSANYSTGLAVGKACVRITVRDGGPNDSDRALDGVISVTGVLGTAAGDGSNPVSPPVVSANNSKGGGALGPGLLFLVLLCMCNRAAARRSVG